MTKTKKFLSVLLAAVMLLGCFSVSSFAISWPAELDAGAVTVRGMSKVSSLEIAVKSDYTTVASDAEFTVYYSEKNIDDDILAITGLEKAGTVGADNAYVTGGVLHLNVSSLSLTKEGYYYVSIGTAALEYDGYYNVMGTSDGAHYQFASLDFMGKLSAVFGYIGALVGNLISNGKTW